MKDCFKELIPSESNFDFLEDGIMFQIHTGCHVLKEGFSNRWSLLAKSNSFLSGSINRFKFFFSTQRNESMDRAVKQRLRHSHRVNIVRIIVWDFLIRQAFFEVNEKIFL